MSKTINDVIEEYCKKKLPPSEIFRLMKEVVSRRGVYKVVKRFKDTGTCAPRIRSDPERTVRTKKLIKKVRGGVVTFFCHMAVAVHSVPCGSESSTWQWHVTVPHGNWQSRSVMWQ